MRGVSVAPTGRRPLRASAARTLPVLSASVTVMILRYAVSLCFSLDCVVRESVFYPVRFVYVGACVVICIVLQWTMSSPMRCSPILHMHRRAARSLSQSGGRRGK